MTTIDTSRLSLRRLSVSDVSQTYADWLNDPDVNRFLETRHSQQTIQSCKEFVAACNENETENLFGIFLKEDGQHIGNAKLGFINKVHSRGQLSLLIGDKSCWGQGLGAEVVSAMTVFGFKQLGLHRIEAGCYEDNLGSLRIFLKAGYTVEGFFPDHIKTDDKFSGCFWLGILNNETP